MNVVTPDREAAAILSSGSSSCYVFVVIMMAVKAIMVSVDYSVQVAQTAAASLSFSYCSHAVAETSADNVYPEQLSCSTAVLSKNIGHIFK